MTFSIAGRCSRTGWFGVAISSSSPAVGGRCAHVRPGVGAACTQNITDPRLGPLFLDLMASAADAREALTTLTTGIRLKASVTDLLGVPNPVDSWRVPHSDPPLVRDTPRVNEMGPAYIEFRQVMGIGAVGRAGVFSGAETLGLYGSAEGDDAVAAGNLLAGREVPAAMVRAFTELDGKDLPERLLAGLRAGLEAGGEAGPVRSAGLLVAGAVSWPVVDLRVDWHDDPVGELHALWQVYQPQLGDYVTRALDPTQAPSYGVPGDL